MTETITTSSKNNEKKSVHHRLTAMEFSSDNLDHLSQLKQMGIRLQPLPDGRKY